MFMNQSDFFYRQIADAAYNIGVSENALYNDMQAICFFSSLHRLQSKTLHPSVFLRGSHAFYYLLGCTTRICNDIDLIAENPVAALTELGVTIESVGDDFACGHMEGTIYSQSVKLNVEAVQIMKPVDTCSVESIPLLWSHCPEYVQEFLPHFKRVSLMCVSMKHLVVDKIFSIAYSLRDTPPGIQNKTLAKSLFDLSFAKNKIGLSQFLTNRAMLLQEMQAHMQQEMKRKDRFSSLGQLSELLLNTTISEAQIDVPLQTISTIRPDISAMMNMFRQIRSAIKMVV